MWEMDLTQKHMHLRNSETRKLSVCIHIKHHQKNSTNMKFNLLKELVTLIQNDLYVILLRVTWRWCVWVHVGPYNEVSDTLRMHLVF